MVKEFKSFISRGNVIDLAIGIIIGGAFGRIVSSLANDLLLPFLGILLGGIDLTELSITIGKATINYGSFFQNIVDFIIIAFSIFLLVKVINNFKREQKKEVAPVAEAPIKEEVILLEEIRDLLKKNKK